MGPPLIGNSSADEKRTPGHHCGWPGSSAGRLHLGMGQAIQRTHQTTDSQKLETSRSGLARSLAARTRRQRGAGLTLRHAIGREFDLPSIRELEIPQMHVTATTFDDIARADRKPARETTDPGTTDPGNHGPLSCLTLGPPLIK